MGVLAKSGMKLGGMGGAKKDSLISAMAAEDNLCGGASKGGADFGFGAPVAPPAAAPSTPLTLSLDEKITVNMNREGAVESCEVKGILNLTANTDAGAAAIIAVNKAHLPSSFNYATHPKVDKKGYEQQGILSLNGGKGFPVGRGVGILRWSYGSEDAAPISINCWPEDEGNGRFMVSIEMELTRNDLVLHDVNILIPLGTSNPPSIESIDGQMKHDPAAGLMWWMLILIVEIWNLVSTDIMLMSSSQFKLVSDQKRYSVQSSLLELLTLPPELPFPMK